MIVQLPLELGMLVVVVTLCGRLHYAENHKEAHELCPGLS
jgi:hypothetical protein